MSHVQESWTVAYSAYILAKQSGFDIRFTDPDDKIPDSEFYMLPSIKSVNCISRRQWEDLLNRVKNGASLYISFSNVFISSFKDIVGLEIVEREIRTAPYKVNFEDSIITLPAVKDGYEDPYRYSFNNNGAEVILTEHDGNPFLVKNSYGKGTIFTMMSSIEFFSSYKQGAFDDEANDLSNFYKLIFNQVIEKKLVIKDKKLNNVAVSEHVIDEHTTVCTIINHDRIEVQSSLKLHEKVRKATVLRGNVENKGDSSQFENCPQTRLHFTLDPNDAAVIEIRF
jgi:hypothetical protein